MFTLSTKVVYGIAAVLELAMAEGKACAQAKEIAAAQGIPEDYLRQLLALLKKAGIVESARGSQGGYVLKRPASEIEVSEVIECLEGRLNFTRVKMKNSTLASYLKRCEKGVRSPFEVTFWDLAAERQRQEKNVVYHI